MQGKSIGQTGVSDTLLRYSYFLSFWVMQLNGRVIVFVIELKYCAKMVVESDGAHVLDADGCGQLGSTCELAPGE